MITREQVIAQFRIDYGYDAEILEKDYRLKIEDYIKMSTSAPEASDRFYYDTIGRKRRSSYILTTICCSGDSEEIPLPPINETFIYYGLNYDNKYGGLKSLTSAKIRALTKEQNVNETKAHDEIGYKFDKAKGKIAAPIYAYDARLGDLSSILFDLERTDEPTEMQETLSNNSTTWRKRNLYIEGVPYIVYLGQYTYYDESETVKYISFE